MKYQAAIVTLCVLSSVCLGNVHKSNFFNMEGKVVGGQDATRGQFPYQASLQLFNSHICGGSLIRESWVVTAAHCIIASSGFVVKLGMLNQGESHPDVQEIPVETITVHEGYPGGVATNDIAVLKLSTPAIISPSVNIIALPPPGEMHSGDATLSGWGLTNSSNPNIPTTLQYVDLPLITNPECADLLIALFGSSDPLDDTMICAGPVPGKDGCDGDSGGPLVQNDELVGVVSWGIMPCATPGAPSAYTRVSSHIDWINNNTS